MKKTLYAIAMGFTLMLTAAANAQTINLKAQIPFKFIAGGVSLPAGEYDIRSMGNVRALSLHNTNSKDSSLVLSSSETSLKPSARSKLVFHRYGSKYFLSEVWVRGDSVGQRIPSASREKEIAMDYPKEDVVLAANR